MLLSLSLVSTLACGPSEPTRGASESSTASVLQPVSASASVASSASSASSSALPPSSAAVSEAPPAKQPKAGVCEPDGSLTHGAVRASQTDMHNYARLMSEAFRKDVVVAGEHAGPDGRTCVRCLDVEGKAETLEEALSLAGARPTMRRGAALLSARLTSVGSPIPGPSRPVDFEFARGSAAEIARIMGDISKREVTGFPDGEITVRVRGRPAFDLLALLADVAGTRLASAGTRITVAPGGLLPALRPETGTSEPGDAPAPILDVIARAEPVANMRLEALIRSPSGARALVRSRQRATPGWVVRVGDHIGKAHTVEAPSGLQRLVNARVERIHCLGVDLSFEGSDKIQLLLQ